MQAHFCLRDFQRKIMSPLHDIILHQYAPWASLSCIMLDKTPETGTSQARALLWGNWGKGIFGSVTSGMYMLQIFPDREAMLHVGTRCIQGWFHLRLDRESRLFLWTSPSTYTTQHWPCYSQTCFVSGKHVHDAEMTSGRLMWHRIKACKAKSFPLGQCKRHAQ